MRYKLTSLPSLRSTTFLSFAALLAVPMISLVSTTQAHAISSKYGCVKVTAESLNIRSKNSSREGEVIAVAKCGRPTRSGASGALSETQQVSEAGRPRHSSKTLRASRAVEEP